MARVDLYQQVTDRVVAELERGVAPWVRPWRILGEAGGLPHNGYTKRPYRGVNVWVLAMSAASLGCDDPRWYTFRQASLLDARVKKGEKATLVAFWRDLKVNEEDPTTGVRSEKTVPLLRAYPVFNASQCDGIPALPAPPTVPTETRYLELQRLLERTTASVHHGGDMAFYSPTTDRIQMPHLAAFVTEEAYWGTMLHELTHWTGHSTRLDRDVRHRFGTLGYAAEELVAELGSAYLCAALGVLGELRHPEYLANWLAAFKGDKRALFRASSFAQRAADFVLAHRDQAAIDLANHTDEDAT